MKQLKAVIKKEFIQMIRDIPGLIILFLMPLILDLCSYRNSGKCF